MNPMNKVLVAVCFYFLCALGVHAQDTIVKTNGEEIRAKVFEVNERYIKFQRVEDLKGASQQLSRSEVAIIKYSNGIKEVINAPAVKNAPIQSETPGDSIRPRHVTTEPDLHIRVDNGRYYYQGSRIGIRQIGQIIENSGNPQAIMEFKIYKKLSRGGKALMIVGISVTSVGVPVFLLSTLLKQDVYYDQAAYKFLTGTQVAGALLGAGGIGCFFGGVGSRSRARLTLEHTIETYNAGIK
jgi:hypothetical protein